MLVRFSIPGYLVIQVGGLFTTSFMFVFEILKCFEVHLGTGLRIVK